MKCTPDVRPCRNNTGTRPLGCTSPWGLLVHLVPSLSLDALVSPLPPARAYRPAVASGPPFGAALCPLNAPAWTSRGAVHGVLVVPPRRPTGCRGAAQRMRRHRDPSPRHRPPRLRPHHRPRPRPRPRPPPRQGRARGAATESGRGPATTTSSSTTPATSGRHRLPLKCSRAPGAP